MAEPWVQSVTSLTVSFTASVTADTVDRFVRLSGDDYEAHTDEEFMARSPFGRRIAHGALLVGYMSAAGTKAIRASRERGNDSVPVSLGYDRLRFLAPVFLGDTMTVSYEVQGVDAERRRSTARVQVVNQTGTLVAAADHVMKWMKADAAGIAQ